MRDTPPRSPLPPPALALVAAVLIYSADRALPALSLEVPGRAWVSLVFTALGMGIAGVALRGFLKAGTTFEPHKLDEAKALVTTGLYRYTRNPMYLGIVFVLLGITAWFGSIPGLAVVAGFVWVITTFQIRPEEQALEKTFGEAFREYMARTRRWI